MTKVINRVLEIGGGSQRRYIWRGKIYSSDQLLDLLIMLVDGREADVDLLEELANTKEENQKLSRIHDMWSDFFRDNKKRLRPIIKEWNLKRSREKEEDGVSY